MDLNYTIRQVYFLRNNLFFENRNAGSGAENNTVVFFSGGNRFDRNQNGIVVNAFSTYVMENENFMTRNRTGLTLQNSKLYGVGTFDTDGDVLASIYAAQVKDSTCTGCQLFTYSGNTYDRFGITEVMESLGTPTNPSSGKVYVYYDDTASVVGAATNDCVLVIRMSDANEAVIGVIVEDGTCP